MVIITTSLLKGITTMIIYGVPPGNVFFGGLVDPPTSADYFFVKLTGIAGLRHYFNISPIATFSGGSKPPPYD